MGNAQHTPQSALVIGAGVIGLATAWRLRQRGVSVTVVDPEPGSGAAYAAAGMLAPITEVVWDQPGLYPLMIESGRRYRSFAEEIVAESGMDVGYLETETMVVAGDSADRTTLRELMALQSDLGMAVDMVTATTARQLEPGLGPKISGAVHVPSDHQINPRSLCAALVHVLADAMVYDKVTQLTWSDGRVTGVQLESGRELSADVTVVAAGVDIPEIGGMPEAVQLPIRPVHGDVLRLRVPQHLQPLVTRVVRGVVQGRPVYIVPRADGTIVLGATSREDSCAGVSAEGVYQLLRDGQRIVPGLVDCEIYEMTARARPGSPDDVPLIGYIADGLVLSGGFFRHGILLTAIGADLTADVITNEPIAPEFAQAINPLRFSTPAMTTQEGSV